MSVLTVALAFGGFLPLAARAAQLTGFSDTMSTLTAGASADHSILFVTPSGVDAPGDMITMTFGSGGSFNLSTIVAGDVDFGVDSSAPFNDCVGPYAEKTLAASASSGVWGAAVTGQVLTLTPPTNALIGEVVASRCVRTLIGLNAATPSAGTHQIVNPASSGQYNIAVGGGFGDSGNFSFSIVDSSDVTVTATVDGPPGGGGGGGGGPVAPNITNVHVINITETTADVLWDTDVAATSNVDYGTTMGYGSLVSTAGTVFNHNVHLTGLTASTLYHFRVRSTGVGTPEATSGDFTFTTLDTTPPVISNVATTNITGTSARITWDTDENADSKVDYGTSVSYGSSNSSAVMTNAHIIDLTGLTPNTVYHFRVTSVDPATNASSSIDFTFMTADTVAPIISNILVDNITTTTARVNWTTNELADSLVLYGTTVSYGGTASSGTLVSNHQIPLSGLAAGTLYHLIVVSKDASGNSATSSDQTFTTSPDTTPPANVTALVVTPANAQNTLTWTNPSDPDFAGVVIRRSTSGYPATPAQGTGVYSGAGTSLVDTGLTNGVTYYYTVFAFDGSGNYASGTLGNGTPFDSTPPGHVTNLVATAGDGHVQLTWNNPGDADLSNVVLRRSTAGYPATPTSGTAVYSGTGQSIDDTGVTNGTTYYYAIWARDTSNNFSSPAQASATPSAPVVTPTCGNNVCESGENSINCPVDCPAPPPPPSCGNNVCDNGETNASCPADCPAAPPPSLCGNAICDPGEDSNSCPGDCPAPVVPPPPVVEPPQTTPPDQSMDRDLIEYYAQNRTIRLIKDQNGAYEALVSRTFSVLIPDEIFKKPVKSIVFNFGNGSYLFRKGEQGSRAVGFAPSENFSLISTAHAAELAAATYWTVDVQMPQNPSSVNASIIVTYDDDTNDVDNIVVAAQPFGVVSAMINNVKTPVEGATVTLYRKTGSNWDVWNAGPYFQSNPTVTTGSGVYGYMVPTGTYYVKVEADGYRTKDGDAYTVPYNIFNRDVELIKIPKTITEVIVPGAPLTENLFNIAKSLGDQTSYITQIVNQEFVQNPNVEGAATNFVVPGAAILTGTVVASAVQATSLASYLYFLLTQPLLLIGMKRRKEYGTVYNALSKTPLDLAIVRLFRANGKLVRTTVTDKSGRYAFLVDEGQYRMEATKPNMKFPSEFLKGRKEDGKFLDLYHGEMITADKNGAILTANIPLDPLEATAKSARRLIFDSILHKVQNGLAAGSIIVSVIAFALYRKWYLGVLAVIQIVLYFAFRRIARPPQPKNWGIIYDEVTKKPVPFAVARIVESEYNKVLESHVTDAKGRYTFLVGNNKYFVTVEKPGYEAKKTREIDLTVEKSGEGVLALDIGIAPTSMANSKPQAPNPKPPESPSP